MSHNPLTASLSRVFIIEGRARVDHKPTYESCVRMSGVSQGFGDVERIECPDPYKYGSFVEVGQIRGATERPTTTLEGRYMRDIRSALMRMASTSCAVDVQLHLGKCQDPSDFNEFDKTLVLEAAYLTNFSTDDLGALASGDDAVVNESADISAKMMYEILPISYGSKAGTQITNEVVDVTICDSVSCGDCEDDSNGCKKIFAITKAAGGSPSTPADVVYSIDGGATWIAHDIESLGVGEDPSAIACVGQYLVVVSNASNSLHYAPLDDFDGSTDPVWTEVTTGFVAGGEPNAIYGVGTVAYIVGDSGYIYYTDDPTSGVSVLDSGTFGTGELLRVHGISETFVVAAGADGRLVYTENGTAFADVTRPVGVGVDITALWVKNEREWFVGTSGGEMYYTLNTGTSWTIKAFSGSGAGTVYDIKFSNDTVGWLSHATAAPAGRVFRTYDGGYSWNFTPESTDTIPANDYVGRIAVCDYDPNFVVGGGLADDGSDGFLIVGA